MTTVLREILNSDKTIPYPCIYDALSAKIAQRVGFDMVGLGGNALGTSLGTSEPLLCLEDIVRTLGTPSTKGNCRTSTLSE
jgi:2-methylisocitrate lyase-like PEP mutase family enzyme